MRTTRVFAAAAVVAGMGIGAAAVAGELEWNAKPMLGTNEVPANASASEARAQFELEDGAIHYKLRMRAPITDAFMAHIHNGRAGANGPIVVWLFGTPPANSNPFVSFGRRDTVAEGTITAANLVGTLAGKPLSDLMALLNSGNAYVNLHTRSFPGGELRAQIVVDD